MLQPLVMDRCKPWFCHSRWSILIVRISEEKMLSKILGLRIAEVQEKVKSKQFWSSACLHLEYSVMNKSLVMNYPKLTCTSLTNEGIRLITLSLSSSLNTPLKSHYFHPERFHITSLKTSFTTLPRHDWSVVEWMMVDCSRFGISRYV